MRISRSSGGGGQQAPEGEEVAGTAAGRLAPAPKPPRRSQPAPPPRRKQCPKQPCCHRDPTPTTHPHNHTITQPHKAAKASTLTVGTASRQRAPGTSCRVRCQTRRFPAPPCTGGGGGGGRRRLAVGGGWRPAAAILSSSASRSCCVPCARAAHNPGIGGCRLPGMQDKPTASRALTTKRSPAHISALTGLAGPAR